MKVRLTGNISKVGCALARELCKQGVQVHIPILKVYEKLQGKLISDNLATNLVFTSTYDQEVWLVGDDLRDEEEKKANTNTLFIPFSQFPPSRVNKKVTYHNTPAFVIPKALENLDSCENWLPRRVMSAWRVAGIVHALENWEEHESGTETMFDVDKVWGAALRHGFRPLNISIEDTLWHTGSNLLEPTRTKF